MTLSICPVGRQVLGNSVDLLLNGIDPFPQIDIGKPDSSFQILEPRIDFFKAALHLFILCGIRIQNQIKLPVHILKHYR